jgi:histidyl-tRNA synthetase
MVAAKRQELAYPLRWYSIPNLWRYERPQNGRLREHWQLNVDIFGIESLDAEIELIEVANKMFESFGADSSMYEIKLNHRGLIDHILKNYLSLSEASAIKIGKLIDKYHKLEKTKFISAVDEILSAKEKENEATEKLMLVLNSKSLKDLPKEIKDNEITKEIIKVEESLKKLGITNASYDPTLMRGFDYYTGIVFEIFDTHPDNNRSMMGGGRYDGLVGLFGVQPVPTAGFGWGDVTLINFLEGHHLTPEIKNTVDIYVVVIGDNLDKSKEIVSKLRNAGINIALDLTKKKIGDQIKTASKKSINYVLVIGDNELKIQEFNLKDLKTGKEESLRIEKIIKKLNK